MIKNILLTLFFWAIMLSNVHAGGWVLYFDGPYQGKAVEAETGKPIKGAVVAGVWRLEAYGGPGGPLEPICDAKEALTDKNGEFIVPRAFCFHLWPFTKLGIPRFVVFKPGYLGYPPLGGSPEERRIQMPEFTGREFRDMNQYYIIKLGKPKTRKEREWTQSDAQDPLDDETYKNLPHLIELINEERRNLDFGEIGPVKNEEDR
jgi:hypothetical protein